MSNTTLVPQNQINLPNNRAPLVDDKKLVTNEWQKWFNNVQVALNTYNTISFAAAMPSHPADGNFGKGQIIFNTAPTPGGYIGWVCTTGGIAGALTNPAVFKTWGPIDS